MSHRYSAFGLSIGSNLRLPGLVAGAALSPADVEIRLGAQPACSPNGEGPAKAWYVSDPGVEQSSKLCVWKTADGRYFRLLYGDGTEFHVDHSGGEIWATWPASLTLEDTATYLLGPVLAFALRLRGVMCLHASAVTVDTRAIAIAGPPQSGKSTLAAAFARAGLPVLTDDVAAVVERDGRPYAVPAYPQLRLWPDSVQLLHGSAEALPPLTPNWDKRSMDLSRRPYRFQQDALPLAAVYVLGERGPDAGSRIESLAGREKLRAMLGNTYVAYLLDRQMRAQEFAFLTRMVSHVAVRRVTPSSDPTALSELCSRILEDCEALACTASPITG